MSLINDALKRAKEAQRQQPPAPPGGPPLRPVDPRPAQDHNVWLMLVFAIVVAAASILLWQWFQQSRQSLTMIASGHPASPAQVPASTVAPESRSTVAPQTAATAAALTPLPAPTNGIDVPPPATGVASLTAAIVLPSAETNAAATTNSSVPIVEVPPAAAPLKLQGILFHPSRPSAVVNGKLVFVGDRVGELRVTAIEQDSVTLVSGGKTNYLTLK